MDGAVRYGMIGHKRTQVGQTVVDPWDTEAER